MSSSSSGKIIGGLFIVAVGVLVIGVLWWLRPTPEARPLVQSRPPVVDVIAAQRQSWQASVASQGTVVPIREIALTAEVSGRVNAVSDQFVEGALFSANEPLVAVDDRDYRYALISADAQVASAEQTLALEKGQARQAKREWRDLGSTEANALSLRQPQIKAAEAALAAARAQRQQALLNIERTQIAAPFDGVVQATAVDVGQFVAAGTVVGTVYDRTAMEVRLPLTSEQLALMALVPGQPLSDDQPLSVSLTAQVAGKPYQWQAQLARLQANIDSRTRFFHATVTVAEPFNRERHPQPLLAGLFVEATIPGRVFEQVVRLPEKVLLNKTIFTVTADNIVQRKPVQVLASRNQQVWVQGDIDEGEQIIISDPRVLREGMTVTPQVIVNKVAAD